ncbi:MAG: PEP/pyruvate-binding domain-containing protein [Calditrichia bacterium]
MRKNHLYDEVIQLFSIKKSEEDFKTGLESSRQKILQSEFPAEIVSKIQKALSELPGERVSVRSSALAEDSRGSSFAGVFETVLDVPREIEPVLQAVQKVWASLFVWNVFQYEGRRKNRSLPEGMGVIIQEMVYPQNAGVVFSINPLSYDPDEIYMEDAPHLGEKVVSGTVTPQTHRIEKNTLTAGESDWRRKIAYDVVRMEQQLGYPVDVEWARDQQNKIFYLQVRPITTVINKKIRVWTDENVGEVLPAVVTPLTWSIMGPMVNKSFRWALGKLGLKISPKESMFRLIQGKAYLNRTLFQRSLQNIFPSGVFSQARTLPLPLRYLYVILHEIVIAGRFLFMTLWLPFISRQWEKRSRPEVAGTADLKNPLEILKHIIGHLLESEQKIMNLHVANTFIGEILYQSLNGLFKRFLPEGQSDRLLKLISNVGSPRSAQSGVELWHLARYVKLRCNCLENFDNFREWSLSDRAFQKKLSEFLGKYGHMSEQEFELSHPRWEEDRTPVLQQIFNIAQSSFKEKPVSAAEAFISQFSSRKVAEENKLFHLFIRLTRMFNRHRENLKQVFVEHHYVLKKSLLLLADVSVIKQKFQGPSDIFFVKIEELFYILSNPEDEEFLDRLDKKIQNRRYRYNEHRKMAHPYRYIEIDGRFERTDRNHLGDTETERGIPCSGGKAEGYARVLQRFEQGRDLKKGEILVTHSANPGWVPLFLLAGGVVTEIGGALSHSAIIAREYGIPMVASVKDACRHIRTGDYVSIDGFRGTVFILKKVKEPVS